jgi:hypothetical protein
MTGQPKENLLESPVSLAPKLEQVVTGFSRSRAGLCKKPAGID